MSWFGWGAKPKTDKDLMERSMTAEEKKYYVMMEKYFKEHGYENELRELYPDTLVRFILGYSHIKKEDRIATYKEKIKNYLDTYRKYRFDNILDTVDENEQELADAWPLFCYGYDKYGHPVYYDCVGDSKEENISKIFKIKDVADESQYGKLFKYKYTFMKRLHNCKRVQSDKHGKMIYKHVLVFDVKNVSFSISEFTGMKSQFAKKLIGSDQDMFPDTLYRLYIINSSLAFRAIWGLLRAFADPITAEKIQVLGSDYMKYLTKQVPIDQIPPKYGGKGKWQIRNGFVADMEDDHYPMRKNIDDNSKSQTKNKTSKDDMKDKDDNKEDNENNNDDDTKKNENDENTSKNTNNNDTNKEDNKNTMASASNPVKK